MLQLHRDYIFEFAGMPQGGKSAVNNILVHYLKRMEYPFEEYGGGSRYNLLYRAPIEELNLELVEQTMAFVRCSMKRENFDHNIYLLDRGLIDRCIFTDALVRNDKVSKEEAERIYESLTAPELLEKLDGVFIFITSPETALRREYQDKLVGPQEVRSKGEVMNEDFLPKMKAAAETWYNNVNRKGLVRHIQLIDTTSPETNMLEIARKVFTCISEWYPELQFQLLNP